MMQVLEELRNEDQSRRDALTLEYHKALKLYAEQETEPDKDLIVQAIRGLELSQQKVEQDFALAARRGGIFRELKAFEDAMTDQPAKAELLKLEEELAVKRSELLKQLTPLTKKVNELRRAADRESRLSESAARSRERLVSPNLMPGWIAERIRPLEVKLAEIRKEVTAAGAAVREIEREIGAATTLLGRNSLRHYERKQTEELLDVRRSDLEAAQAAKQKLAASMATLEEEINGAFALLNEAWPIPDEWGGGPEGAAGQVSEVQGG